MAKTYTFQTLGLLHGTVNESLRNISSLVASIFGVSVAFISVIEQKERRCYVSAYVGPDSDNPDFSDIPVEGSICQYVRACRKTVVIPDLLEDARTQDNEFAIQNGLRSYIGSPIHTISGRVIGAICCMSEAPRVWTQGEVKILEGMAHCVDDIIKARTLAVEKHNLHTDLQELMAARSGYLAHVSHEIRTPLTGILGSIKLLETAKTEEQSQKLMSILNRSADKLLDFLNDVLDLAKLDAGHFETVEEETDIGMLVSDTLAEFQDLAEAKSVSLFVDDQLVGNTYFTDRSAVQTILQNLIGNAVKFTDQGSITVTVDEDSYGQVSLAVTDTGIGIAPEHHEKIFKEFEQAENTTARTYGGTGLGMPIVKRMVDRMDGKISVKSQLGQGAQFSILLPLQPTTQGEVTA
ncbi:GAF domain-containing sensor histidine kinase [Sulfitobacter sp. M22]|uniref:GAF domain-containing sensor histidine kinase n=1 Tax=Sulfitobacter sp. M22 TaxID=2675332 RepID=UPI001F25A1BE|nr:GAF domain-containing protein [Sulfitobacter sp. M22]MCF7728084.1 GAF domain-containing protein [Sulfitobacter sp. M22]